MDFLFVPIHDHLHWSLLIVCNPGADPEDTSRTPCMLHLDSMTGMHHTCMPICHIHDVQNCSPQDARFCVRCLWLQAALNTLCTSVLRA